MNFRHHDGPWAEEASFFYSDAAAKCTVPADLAPVANLVVVTQATLRSDIYRISQNNIGSQDCKRGDHNPLPKSDIFAENCGWMDQGSKLSSLSQYHLGVPLPVCRCADGTKKDVVIAWFVVFDTRACY